MRRLYWAAGTVLIVTALGCAGTSVRTYARPSVGERQYGKIKKVAVLPFDSVVEGDQPRRLARDLFVQELLARGTFEAVEEPRYVQDLMKKLKLRNTEGLDREVVRKIGEELQAQALVLGDLLLFGQEENSEVVEFALQVNLLDAETGDLIWAGRTYARASTTLGEILGVNQGPSPSNVAAKGIAQLVARLDREFRAAREAEVQRLLEAAKVQEIAGEEGTPAGAGPTPSEGGAPPPEEKGGEEILLKVKPK